MSPAAISASKQLTVEFRYVNDESVKPFMLKSCSGGLLEVWHFRIIPFSSPLAELAQVDPETETHSSDHYFCIKRWQDIKNLRSVDKDHIFKQYSTTSIEVGYLGAIFSPLNLRNKLPTVIQILSSMVDLNNAFGCRLCLGTTFLQFLIDRVYI